jgi:hypothetical protein
MAVSHEPGGDGRLDLHLAMRLRECARLTAQVEHGDLTVAEAEGGKRSADKKSGRR